MLNLEVLQIEFKFSSALRSNKIVLPRLSYKFLVEII